MVFAVQLETAAETPLIVTEFPARKPMPVMVTMPPLAGTVAGVMVSA